MIKKVRIKNFRSYKNIEIELHPGLNIFIGDNDVGKTNIHRAIKWAALNQPSGFDYRSTWGGDSCVELDVDENTVKRFRNSAENYYTVTTDGEESEPLRSFKRGVPQVVKDILNISEINIHSQLDGPFLLSKSPPDVAKHYNGLVNLDIINRSIMNINSVVRKERGQQTLITEEYKEAEASKKKFDWIVDADVVLKALERLEKDIETEKAKRIQLRVLMKRADDLLTKKERAEEVIKHEAKVLKLISLANEITKRKGERDRLKDLVSKRKRLELSKRRLKKVLKFEKKADELIQLYSDINDEEDLYDALATLVEKRRKLEGYQERIIDIISEKEMEYGIMMPDICPLCERSSND